MISSSLEMQYLRTGSSLAGSSVSLVRDRFEDCCWVDEPRLFAMDALGSGAGDFDATFFFTRFARAGPLPVLLRREAASSPETSESDSELSEKDKRRVTRCKLGSAQAAHIYHG